MTRKSFVSCFLFLEPKNLTWVQLHDWLCLDSSPTKLPSSRNCRFSGLSIFRTLSLQLVLAFYLKAIYSVRVLWVARFSSMNFKLGKKRVIFYNVAAWILLLQFCGFWFWILDCKTLFRFHPKLYGPTDSVFGLRRTFFPSRIGFGGPTHSFASWYNFAGLLTA